MTKAAENKDPTAACTPCANTQGDRYARYLLHVSDGAGLRFLHRSGIAAHVSTMTVFIVIVNLFSVKSPEGRV